MKTTKLLSYFFVVGALTLGLSACSTHKNKSGDGTGLSESDLDAQREARFGDGSIPMAEGEGMFRDIHFEYDSSRITDSARQEIESNVETLKSNPEIRIQLEGHCDERGTAEYNLALGNHRAKAVQDALASYGVSPSRLSTISYGAEVPLDQGHNEMAWAKNRRVHFSAFKGSGNIGSRKEAVNRYDTDETSKY